VRTPRTLTPAEADQLERLCTAAAKRELTREETIEARLLQGFEPAAAESLAATGGLPRTESLAIED